MLKRLKTFITKLATFAYIYIYIYIYIVLESLYIISITIHFGDNCCGNAKEKLADLFILRQTGHDRSIAQKRRAICSTEKLLHLQ